MVGGLRMLCWTLGGFWVKKDWEPLIQNGCVGLVKETRLTIVQHAWNFLQDCWKSRMHLMKLVWDIAKHVQIVCFVFFFLLFGNVINLILSFVLFHSFCWLCTVMLHPYSLLKCYFPKPRSSIMTHQMSLNPQSSGASPIPAFQVCIYLNGSSFPRNPLKFPFLPGCAWIRSRIYNVL